MHTQSETALTYHKDTEPLRKHPFYLRAFVPLWLILFLICAYLLGICGFILLARLDLFVEPLGGIGERRDAMLFAFPHADHGDDEEDEGGNREDQRG
jgi:hypothetical protein